MAKRLFILLSIFTMVIATHATNTYAEHSVLSSGRWVKIRVSNTGVYQLTASQLSEMGFNNPSAVRLFGYNLPILPEANIENISDDLTEIPLWRRSDGTLLFYSCGTIQWTKSEETKNKFTHKNNPYSNYIYYFLSEGTPVAFPSESPSTTPTHTATTFPEHSVMDMDEFSFINVGRTFFEEYEYDNNGSRTYTISTLGVNDGTVLLDIQFASTGASTLYISANGNNLMSKIFTDVTNHSSARINTISTTLSNNYANIANITLSHKASATTVTGHLDFIRANYTRKLDLNGLHFMAFRPADEFNYQVTITGAKSDTRVWKVTTPARTCEQKGSLSGSNYIAELTNEGNDEYVAVNINANFPSPEYVGEIANQDLHSCKDIEFVIIVPENGRYTAQAQRLANAHIIKEGMKCLVVRADQIYNEFSSGTPDATAYRRFMKMLYDKAQTDGSIKAPRNLLFFGACYWDNRMVTSTMKKKSPADYLLSYESDNSISMTESYLCEEYFGLLTDNSGHNPLKEAAQIGIGRLPVTDLTTATNVVTKLIKYINNENAGAWKNTICFMGDDGDNNIHMDDAENVITSTQDAFPKFRYKKIYWDHYPIVKTSTGSTYPAVLEEVNKTMHDGALVMNYTGHGSASLLSHEQVLKTEDFQKWSSPRLPLWFTAACDVTPYDMNKDNIGTEAVFNKRGAAMGFVGTARTVYSTQNRIFNRYFMKQLLGKNAAGQRNTIGEAITLAKASIATSRNISNRDAINKTHFVLIGDPAITLATPNYNIKVDQINGTAVSETNQPTISAGNVVSVTGHIEDEEGNPINDYNGTIEPVVYDNLETIKCHRNSSADTDTAYIYHDRTRTLFAGSEKVSNGQFTFSFPVPLDINYSNKTGLINLYANNGLNEAHGNCNNFIVGGTGNYVQDGNGPTITAYLNRDDFNDGDDVNETPYLFLQLHDPDGINTTGNGIGHDIEIIIDNDEQKTYSLNKYFTPTTGGYANGTVGFSIPELGEGPHTMLIRAFDVLNNMGSTTLNFNVIKGLKPDVTNLYIKTPVSDNVTMRVYSDRKGSILNVNLWVYDMYGKLHYAQSQSGEENIGDYYEFEWNITGTVGLVPPGVYIARVGISTADGEECKTAKKILIVGSNK
ncbi:MAG: type IX secretion system sortase PorU [Bacteroidaceae bacterium]|nr:type IX secretion system sortase PorU [Bacteroidaceae bacterium]